MMVRFALDNRWVASVGGKDRAAVIWRVRPLAADHSGTGGSSKETALEARRKSPAVKVYMAPVRKTPPMKVEGGQDVGKVVSKLERNTGCQQCSTILGGDVTTDAVVDSSRE